MRRAKEKAARGTSGFSRSWTAGTAPVFEAVGREMAPPTGTLQDRERGQVCHTSGAMMLTGSRPSPGTTSCVRLRSARGCQTKRRKPGASRAAGGHSMDRRLMRHGTWKSDLPALPGREVSERRCAFRTPRRRAWRHAGAVRCGNGGFRSVAAGAGEGTFSPPVRRQAPKPKARVGAPIHMPGSPTCFPSAGCASQLLPGHAGGRSKIGSAGEPAPGVEGCTGQNRAAFPVAQAPVKLGPCACASHGPLFFGGHVTADDALQVAVFGAEE